MADNSNNRIPWRKNVLALLGMAWGAIVVIFALTVAYSENGVTEAIDVVSEPLVGLFAVTGSVVGKLVD